MKVVSGVVLILGCFFTLVIGFHFVDSAEKSESMPMDNVFFEINGHMLKVPKAHLRGQVELNHDLTKSTLGDFGVGKAFRFYVTQTEPNHSDFSKIEAALVAYSFDGKFEDQGWGRLIRSRIERLSGKQQKIILPSDDGVSSLYGGTELVDVHYSLPNFNSELELYSIAPQGNGTDNYSTWNQRLLWSGDFEGLALDFIECANGTLQSRGNELTCSQFFNYQELASKVRLTYPRSQLNRWREFKNAAIAQLDSYMSKPINTISSGKGN